MIAKTPQEKAQLKTAKKSLSDLKKKHPVMYKEQRDSLIKLLVNSSVPNWGSVMLNVIK